MSERLAFVSMSAGLATGGEGAGRGRSLGAVDLNQPRHTLPESILQIQGGADPGGHFLKGQSGNLADWPPGSQDRAALAAELNGELEAPTRKARGTARNGDPRVLRLCVDRITAPRHAR